jgi:hypothetical protein
MIVNIGGDDGDGQRYFGEHDQVIGYLEVLIGY